MIFTEPSPSSGKWFYGIVYNENTGDADAGDCKLDFNVDGNGDAVGTYVDSTYVKISITNNGASSRNIKWRAVVFADNGQ